MVWSGHLISLFCAYPPPISLPSHHANCCCTRLPTTLRTCRPLRLLLRAGPAGLPKSQSTAARASLTSLHMGKTIYQKKEIIKGVR